MQSNGVHNTVYSQLTVLFFNVKSPLSAIQVSMEFTVQNNCPLIGRMNQEMSVQEMNVVMSIIRMYKYKSPYMTQPSGRMSCSGSY